MRKYCFRSIDGQIYAGDTFNQVVEQMRAASFDASTLTLREYMRRVAATATLWTKAPIATHSCKAFVGALCRTGILENTAMRSKP
jgi:hypothetical protein